MIAAVVLGIGGAVATKAANHKTKAGDSYYWFKPNNTTYVEYNDVSDEMSTNCPGSANPCENGFTQGQLINGDPHQGVIPGQTPSAVLYED